MTTLAIAWFALAVLFTHITGQAAARGSWQHTQAKD